MAGLTDEGFTADTLSAIQARIEGRLKVYDPEIDLDIASPDGQNVSIFSFEVATLWQQLGLVYNSYNPDVTSGQGLRNLGLLTGIPFGSASRSTVNLALAGTAGTVVPKSSIVTDQDGNDYTTSFAVTLPGSTECVALQAGPILVPAANTYTIKTVVSGWTTATQAADGTAGGVAQTPQQYRNLRNRTVMRNSSSVADVVASRLYELGLEQASVVNNDSSIDTLPDGTPPQNLHVTIGEYSGVSRQQIALTVLEAKGLGCPTWSVDKDAGAGGNWEEVEDNQGVTHRIYFDEAVAVPIYVGMTVTFLDEDYAGAEEQIKQAVADDINTYLTGEDVDWSRLFGVITQFGKASIDIDTFVPQLFIGNNVTLPTAPSNVPLSSFEYATCSTDDITITVSNV
jgi:hypothetical protein